MANKNYVISGLSYFSTKNIFCNKEERKLRDLYEFDLYHIHAFGRTKPVTKTPFTRHSFSRHILGRRALQGEKVTLRS